MAAFEQDLSELEKVVEQLERGDLSLEDSVALFERGVQLSRSCKSVLANAESRLQALAETGPNGEYRVEEIAVNVEEDSDEDSFEDEDSE